MPVYLQKELILYPGKIRELIKIKTFKSAKRKYIYYDIIAYTILLGSAIVFIFPVLWMFLTSLKPINLVSTKVPVVFFKPVFKHYQELLFNGRFLQSYINSIIIAIGHSILAISISLPAAYSFSRLHFRGKKVISYWVLLTRCLPPIGMAVPFYLVYAKLGLINTRVGLIIIYLTLNLSFGLWMLRSFIDSIPPELEEAAFIDGCNRFQVLTKITLPLITPGLISTGIYIFIVAWSEFMYAFIFTGFESKTAPVEIQSYITPMGINWSSMSAAGILIVAPTIVFYVLVRKYIISGLTFGGLKE